MKLLKRFGYYLVGLSLGCVVVLFIWKGKDVSFDYGMDARTLKTIRTKRLVYSDQARASLVKYKLDSTAIHYILKNGDVNFGKSNQRKKPCAEYFVYGNYNDKTIDLWVIRCDSIATIDSITQKELVPETSFFSSIIGRVLIALIVLLLIFLGWKYKKKG
ncbi:MAG: DUF4258 domain-containing protein [Flavobacteriaceae bacterium]